MSRLIGHERDELRDLVLIACQKILAAGGAPSERQLLTYFPDRGVALLINLRDELRYAGRLKWNPSADRSRAGKAAFAARPGKANPKGRTDAEQRIWLQCQFRAVKIAKGEPPRPRTPPSVRETRPAPYVGPEVTRE